MIKYLYLENFKGIAAQKFEFSHINIFAGPNNAGKSSVLSALNLIAQSFNDENPNYAPLILNGTYEDLGTYHDLVHGHNIRKKITIGIGVADYSFEYKFRYRKQKRQIEIAAFTLKKKNKPLYSYSTNANNETYEIKIKSKKIENSWAGKQKRRPIIRGLHIRDMLISNRMYYWDITDKGGVNGDLVADIAPNVKNASLAKQIKSGVQVYESMRDAYLLLRGAFSEYDFLGAFRERPVRTYLFSGKGAHRIGKTGAGAIDMLVSDSSMRGRHKKVLIENVSEWFQKTGMAEGISVKALTSRHYEICLRDKGGKEHNICDVGFGCSQVLPVIAASYSFASNLGSDTILTIQEPEIHLHPNAQAELGSLFSSICKNGQLFIETHSPYLIIRLQTDIAKAVISKRDAKFFYVKKKAGVSTFYDLRIGSDGIFLDKWPEGFFPQRQSETLELARHSGKHYFKG